MDVAMGTELTPWEQRHHLGMARGLFETLKQAAFSPGKFFGTLRSEAPWTDAFGYGWLLQESRTVRVLVTWGSKRGGTEGVARMVGAALAEPGHEAVLLPASQAHREGGFDAAIVGGALYANRWDRSARRFVWRRRAALRKVPVWLFSSRPLDDSADRGELSPTPQVRALAELVGAQGHVTFGGRLSADAQGFP